MSMSHHQPDCASLRGQGRDCDCGGKHALRAVANDPINHPAHYTRHPSGVECIEITEHFNFNLGNAIKYVWRAGLKSPNAAEDLKKAAWYINREIERLTRRGA